MAQAQLQAFNDMTGSFFFCVYCFRTTTRSLRAHTNSRKCQSESHWRHSLHAGERQYRCELAGGVHHRWVVEWATPIACQRIWYFAHVDALFFVSSSKNCPTGAVQLLKQPIILKNVLVRIVFIFCELLKCGCLLLLHYCVTHFRSGRNDVVNW